jgi:anaerobic ribonucleoside-triphosphate reductase activating protein
MTTLNTNLYPEIFPALNVAEMDLVQGAAGPGRRLVIWLQGCLKRCIGCANGSFLPERVGRQVSVAELIEVLEASAGLDGITLSGGEPVLQAAALVPLLAGAHLRGLTVVCYTGYTLEELTEAGAQDSALAKFLGEVDLLIDGEYRQGLARAGAYRPSANQRLHFLSGRISEESCGQTVETVFEIGAGRVTTTGTLPASIRRALAAKLRERGVVLGPGS